MSDPIGFYRSFQALLRERAITGVLTSGMACVEYGLQQNTKDTDWIVDPADIANLVTMFGELERGVSGANWRVSYRGLFGAPLDAEYLAGGWTSHLVAFDEPESAERHLYFFGRPPRVSDAWRVDAVAGIASRDVVARMHAAAPPGLRRRPPTRAADRTNRQSRRATGRLRPWPGAGWGARGGDS